MTKQVQRRRGTATQHTSFTGAEGEISVNTTNKSVHVHDGVTAGGVEAARADLSNVSEADVSAALAGATDVDINGGNIDGTVIGANSAAAITGTTITGTSFVTSGNMSFGDNDKAIFGAGSDLQIYHTGSASRIQDTGTGNLYIAGTNLQLTNADISDNYLQAVDGGALTIYHNGSPKLATTSTGVDVTGTVTADGLTVGANDVIQFGTSNTTGIYRTNSGNDLTMQHWGNVSVLIDSDNNDANNRTFLVGKNAQDAGTAGKIALFSEGGDISFYEDTGTTAKFFWDASAERLGLGTTNPSASLHIANASSTHMYLRGSSGDPYGLWVNPTGTTFTLGSWGNGARINLSDSSEYISFGTGSASTERMRITSSGSVGIGTSSPDRALHVESSVSGASTSVAALVNPNGGVTGTGARLWLSGTNATTRGAYIDAIVQNSGNAHDLVFATGGNASSPVERLRIDSSGNVGIGTDSPHDSGSSYGDLSLSGASGGTLSFLDDGVRKGFIGSIDEEVRLSSTTATGHLTFRSGTGGAGTEAMRIDSVGKVGIGTSSPTYKFEVSDGTRTAVLNPNALLDGIFFGTKESKPLILGTGDNERMRITSSGSVGIGTTSPNAQLQLTGDIWTGAGTAADPSIKVGDNNTGFYYVGGNVLGVTTNGSERLRIDASGDILAKTIDARIGSDVGAVEYGTSTNNSVRFYTSDTEAMRLDGSGNLLVGKTALNSTSEGVAIAAGGKMIAVLDGNAPLRLNRLTSDGDIVELRKNGSTVGSIGTYGNTTFIQSGSGASYSGLLFNSAEVEPTKASGGTGGDPRTDNAINLGSSGYRFKDLYLSGLIRSVGIYNNTSGAGANLGVASSGELYRSTSSLRYKTDVQDAQHGLTEVLSLRPVTYRGINDGDTVFGGLIAEEVHDAGLTEFVEYNEDGDPDAIAYANMVSLCIKAIQEQQATITALETRLTALENN